VSRSFKKEWKGLANEREVTSAKLLERALELLKKDKPKG
jgi:mRNA-degrading endonuclease YafQ of YafQ-DinJ toxin-antitoxin module